MHALRHTFLIAAVSAALAGCSSVESFLLPSDNAPRETIPVDQSAAAPEATQASSQDLLTLSEEANTLSSPMNIGDEGYVKNAIATLESGVNYLESAYGQRRNNYTAMQDNITASAKAYLDIVSDIRAKLQVGTTPGNPQLLSQLNSARVALDALGSRVINLRELNNTLDRDLSQAIFLKQMGRNAQFIQGSAESDLERIQSDLLRLDRTTRTMETMRDSSNRLIERQQGLEQIHRNELNLLNQIIYRGVNAESFSFRADELTQNGANQALNAPVETSMATPAVQVSSLADNTKTQPAAGNPELLSLTLAGKKKGFEESLYNAISKAHTQNADVTFALKGVYPTGKTKAETKKLQQQAKKDADTVLTAMVDMGVPASRVTVSVAAGTTDAVQVQLLQN
jgi:hypothetical protein